MITKGGCAKHSRNVVGSGGRKSPQSYALEKELDWLDLAQSPCGTNFLGANVSLHSFLLNTGGFEQAAQITTN